MGETTAATARDEVRRFAWALFGLDTVERLRAELRKGGGFAPLPLLEGLGSMVAEATAGGRTAEAELVRFLRDLVIDVIAEAGWRPESDGGMEGSEPAAPEGQAPSDAFLGGLVNEAIGRRTAIGMVDALRPHRAKLTAEVYDQVQGWFASGEMDGLVAPLRLTFVGVVGVLAGGLSAARVELLWGAASRRLGLFVRAERHLARAGRLAEAAGDPEVLAAVAGAQASLFAAAGRTVEAADAYLRGLRLAEETGADKAVTAPFCSALARTYRGLGRYTQALQMLDAAIPVYERLRVWDRVAEDRRLRGLLLEDIGDYESGAAEYRAVVQLARELGDRGLEFQSMNDAAASVLKRGDAREGVRRFREVLVLVQGWEDPRATASAHNNLGAALLQAHRPAEALAEYRQAFGVKLESDPHGMAISCFGMGDALRDLGDGDPMSFYTLALMNHVETGDPMILVDYLTRIDDDRIGDDPKLLAMLEEGLEAAREQGDLLSEVLLTGNLAGHLLRVGERERAVALYREGVRRGEEADPRSPNVIRLRVDLAQVLAERPDGVGEAYGILIGIRDEVERRLGALALDVRRGEVIAEWIRVYGGLIDLQVEHGADLSQDARGEVSGGGSRDPVVGAFELHEAAKSRTFLSALSRATFSVPETVPPELRERERRLLEVESALQDASPTEIGSETYRLRRLREVGGELEACWDEMAAAAPSYVRLRQARPLRFDELRRVLAAQPDRVAAVSFFCHEDHVTCFVVRPDRDAPAVHRFDVSRDALKDAAARLRSTFNGSPGGFPPAPPIRRDQPFDRTLDFLDEVGRELLGFMPSVEGADLLCVAPHGPLHLLPFHAFRDAGGTHLGERFGVAYAPSLATLAYTLRPDPGSREGRGGPPRAYVASVAANSDRHPEYFEADAEIFASTDWDRTVAEGPAEASRDRVLAELPRHDVVHLTCHGFFDDADPMRSGLLLSNGRDRPPRDLARLPLAERRSFVLQARDFMRTRMGADLVTVRACSTGFQAERNAGDEFEGLTRSLLYAGNRAVLAALWNVDQQSSLDLLRRFYRAWGGPRRDGAGDRGPRDDGSGMPKWKALATAQHELLASPGEQAYLRHTYHWAPFILIGDWR